MGHTDRPRVWNGGGREVSCYSVRTGRRVKQEVLKIRGRASNC